MESSTKDAAKKERERYYLERVKALYSDFPSGQIIETERPDFLIASDAGVVGIDLADYIREQGEKGSPLRHKEKVCDEIADMAQLTFESKNDVPLQVHFHWYWHRKPNTAERKEIANQVAELIDKHLPKEIYGRNYIDPDEEGAAFLGDFLTRVSIMRLKPDAKRSWSNVEFGFVEVEAEDLQQLISSKEKNITAYRANCVAIWLVLVADATHISSSIEFNRSISQHIFATRFDRVLVYNHLNQSVVSLSIALSKDRDN
jgi:hypothetical protein